MGANISLDRQRHLDSQTAAPLIMVVDDEVLIRLMAADMLIDAGFSVVEACSADEAVSLLATGIGVDLVFTDVNMPGTIDGLGLAAHVKKAHPMLPVILTSGGVPAHLLAMAEPAAVIPKPYTEAEVTRVIGKVLDRRFA